MHGGLSIEGTAERPVVLRGRGGETWGGVTVLASGADVELSNVSVRDVKRSAEGKDFIDAAVFIHDANVRIDHVTIENTQTEDGLNLFSSRFDIRSLNIQNTKSDALDIDFGDGVIDGFMVRNSGGDALDLSGTKLRASNLDFADVHDKGISVGEVSNAELSNVRITRAGTAVVSKDLSLTRIKGIILESIKNNALMAYSKKPEYGPGTLHAEEVNQTNVRGLAVAQSKSVVTIDGNVVEAVDLDVDSLYQTGYMKKN